MYACTNFSTAFVLSGVPRSNSAYKLESQLFKVIHILQREENEWLNCYPEYNKCNHIIYLYTAL